MNLVQGDTASFLKGQNLFLDAYKISYYDKLLWDEELPVKPLAMPFMGICQG